MSLCVGVFSVINLFITVLSLLLWLAYHIFPTTYWVPTISVLNLAKLLLRNWRRFGILRWGVLDERLPLIDYLCSYSVFLLLCFKSVRLSILYAHKPCIHTCSQAMYKKQGVTVQHLFTTFHTCSQATYKKQGSTIQLLFSTFHTYSQATYTKQGATVQGLSLLFICSYNYV
jgi:hypothetical protein